jgi:hypothetical protein
MNLNFYILREKNKNKIKTKTELRTGVMILDT